MTTTISTDIKNKPTVTRDDTTLPLDQGWTFSNFTPELLAGLRNALPAHTTSTEWEIEIRKIAEKHLFPKATPYDKKMKKHADVLSGIIAHELGFDEIVEEWIEDVRPIIEKALTQQREELLDALKMKHKTCGGDLQMNDEYEQCHGFNKAVDELNKKLATLREKYSV